MGAHSAIVCGALYIEIDLQCLIWIAPSEPGVLGAAYTALRTIDISQLRDALAMKIGRW